MNIVSKLVGGLSIFVCAKDIHETAKIYSNRSLVETSSDVYIQNSIKSSKTNGISPKNARIKDWLFNNDFLIGLKEGGAKVGGYMKGLATSAVKYIPNFVIASVALLTKSKKIGALSSISLVGLEIFDFFKSSTNVQMRSDYLNVK